MKLALSTGNAIVDEISEMSITGNIIPAMWFRTLRGENDKPMLLAIDILSDVVYWYRAQEIRDEDSGELIGYKKRFKKDLLQRSYRQIEKQFGVSKKQARLALDFLCDVGVVRKHLRNERSKDGLMLHNNMYLELVPERLKEITFPIEKVGGVPSREPPYALTGTTVVPCKTQGGALQGTTSTKNTTETTNLEYINPINQHSVAISDNCHMDLIDKMDEIDAYRKVIKDNIDYDVMRSRFKYESDRKRFDEIYEILCDVVTMSQGTVRVGREDKPYQIVKSVFLKIKYEHVEYVMDCMNKTVSDIGNIRSYLITALYRSVQTMENSLNQQVNHGQYEYAKKTNIAEDKKSDRC